MKFKIGQKVMAISSEGKPYKVVTIKRRSDSDFGWEVEEIKQDGRYINDSQLRELTPLEELL